MLDLAKHIIKTKKGEFDPKAFDDRYEEALAEVVRAGPGSGGRATRREKKAAPAKSARKKPAATRAKAAPRRKAV